jgi:hypothetical protein
MHTLMVIGIGLIGLLVAGLLGRTLGGVPGMAQALLLFVPLWFLGAAMNLYIGVMKAGYALSDEAPIFLIVFAVPALLALLIWWKFH